MIPLSEAVNYRSSFTEIPSTNKSAEWTEEDGPAVRK